MANTVKKAKKKEKTPVKKPVAKQNTPVKNPDDLNFKSEMEIVKRRLYTDSDRKDGARSKFDDVNQEIIDRTRRGLSKKDRVGGLITETTYKTWYNEGEKDLNEGVNSQFSAFFVKIREAEKEFRDGLLECIKKHAPDDWKAAVWLMERSDPESYKLKDKVEMNSTVEVSQKAILEIPDNGRRTVS